MPRLHRPLLQPPCAAGLVLLLASAVACAPPVSGGPPRPEPARGAVAPNDETAAPWTVLTPPGSGGAVIRFEAELLSRVDTVERRDSLRAVVSATWSRLGGDTETPYTGLVTAYATSADTGAPVPPVGLRLPVPFAATAGAAGLAPRLVRPDPSACGLEAIATQPLREILLTLPRRLDPGTTWVDSARFTLCRDSIPLRVQSTREYRALRAEPRDGGAVVLVERRSRTTMEGEGRQFGEPVEIRATGDGTMELAIRLADGFVADGRGTSELRMTMRGRRRSQELIQRTRIEITAP